MITETKVKCVCGEFIQIVNSSHDTTSWAACSSCERCSIPFDIGTPGNAVIADFKNRYKEDYEALETTSE